MSPKAKISLSVAAILGVLSEGIAVNQSLAQSPPININYYLNACRQHGDWGQWEIHNRLLYGTICSGSYAITLYKAQQLDSQYHRGARYSQFAAAALCNMNPPECFVRDE